MNTKTKNIINWVLAGLVAFVFIGSAISKLTMDAENLANMAKMGLNESNIHALGVIEIIAAILFLVPRTSIIGSLLLIAYMGGAIATCLQQGQQMIPAIAISVFVWIVSFVRNPELSNRILEKM
jgi:uncharacterized membrane protein YphA (DoxX/SURF4 family)